MPPEGQNSAPYSRLLDPERNCWRVEDSVRAAFLIDNDAYFAAAKSAILKSRSSIFLVGWQLDPRRRLDPEGGFGSADQIGCLLREVADERPHLDVRVLIWNAALGIALGRRVMPHRAWLWFRNTPVHFRLDGTVPLGASHHQKLLVIDDAVAFCAGDDFGANRWDRAAHRDREPNRRTPWGLVYPPRHGLTLLVDGAAAQALGSLARERWQRATGEILQKPPKPTADPWPDAVTADLQGAAVGISRTMPRWRGQTEVRENEALYVDAIRAARDVIYLENQYFTSGLVGDALSERLTAEEGPEIILITGQHAPNFFDRAAMDPPRDLMIKRLHAVDRYGRFQVYAPHTAEGRPVLVHSKVMIVDDRIVRIGSSNIANRSLGYDSECDLTIEPLDQEGRDEIIRLRNRLIGHFLGVDSTEVAHAAAASATLISAIETLGREDGSSLRPLHPHHLSFRRSFVAKLHLGDPRSANEAWRPWKWRWRSE